MLDTIESIGSARKNQYAAFVREEGVLVVWADTVQQLIPTAKTIEASLVAFLWQDETDFSQTPILGKSPRPTLSRSAMTSRSNFSSDSKSPMTPMTGLTTPSIFGDKHEGQMPDHLPVPTGTEEKVDTNIDMEDPYKAEMMANRKLRPVSLISPFVCGLAVALAIVLMCLGLSKCFWTHKCHHGS